jgi:rhodanese-related sulfurtransferase
MAKKQTGTISKRMRKRAEQRRKRRLTQAIIALVAIVIIAGGVWAVLEEGPPATESESNLPKNINVETAYEMYQAGEFVLDVRTQEEWDEFHIPGATLIPLDQLESRVNEVPRDRDVVVICRSGNRSQVGRDTLLDAGFTRVTSVDGGMNDWRDTGYPVE